VPRTTGDERQILERQRLVTMPANGTGVKCLFACILAIAGWYLLYPPANHMGNPDSYTALSQWNIDSSYGTASDCHEAHHGDLDALQGLEQDSPDYLQTQAGRCVAADDPRLVE